MIRLSSSAVSFTCAPWAPVDDTLLQLQAADNSVSVEVQARLDDTAPWVTIATLNAGSKVIERVARMPKLQLVMYGNNRLSAVKVWDGE